MQMTAPMTVRASRWILFDGENVAKRPNEWRRELEYLRPVTGSSGKLLVDERTTPYNDSVKLWLIVALICFSGCKATPPPSPWGSYPNRPLALVDFIPPDRRRWSLTHEFNYIDPAKQMWEAPAGLIVDGASIPRPFWSVIGGPFEGLYREASIVHDAGCCAQMQPWSDVHHMFYNAMRCSGVGWAKAKTMFWAVWAFGPRWKQLNTSMPAACRIASPSGTPPALRSRSDLPPSATGDEILRVIASRKLTLPEARAVARPFFTRGPMTDADATEFAAKLQHRTDLTPEERQVIALSVAESERISDEEVRNVEQWIEKNDPPLETIQVQAEEVRQKKITELRLFPEATRLKSFFGISTGTGAGMRR